LDGLEAALAELEASLLALDIDKMSADLIEMNDIVAQLTVEQEEANEAAAQALLDIQDILTNLNAIKVKLENAITKDQIASLAAQFAEVNEKVQLLVFLADYDYDGVMNGLDQCPDTPITQINSVNENGCSPEQLAG
jgi:predicted KAP-like P-loop ATPase